jgi:uncharacterized protein (DUF433 family)
MAERIAVNPQVHFGTPCVAGTWIPVQRVLELVRQGISFADTMRDHCPDLRPEDIHACIQYAEDVWAAVDAIFDRLSASDRSFSDSADMLREDRDR